MYKATDYLLNMDIMERNYMQRLCNIEGTNSHHTRKDTQSVCNIEETKVEEGQRKLCTMPTTTLLNLDNMERNYMQSVCNIEEATSQDTRKDMQIVCNIEETKGEEGQRLYVQCHRLLTKHG
jgi:hypothetical protein